MKTKEETGQVTKLWRSTDQGLVMNIPRSIIRSTIKKWKEYGPTTNLPREGRTPKLKDQARRPFIREETKRPKINLEYP